MQAPAASASLAAGQQLQSLRHSDVCPCRHDILSITQCTPLDSDTRPSVHCVDGSMTTASISAIIGCRPLRPLHPRHCTLRPDRPGRRPQRLQRLWQRGSSSNLFDTLNLSVTRIYASAATTPSALPPASRLTRTHTPADIVSTAAGDNFDLCDTRMHAPAVTTSSA